MSPRSRGREPESHSNAGTLPDPPDAEISRRGMSTAAGAGLGVVVCLSSASPSPLEPLGLIALGDRPRSAGVPVQPDRRAGKIARGRHVADAFSRVVGPKPYRLTLEDLGARAVREARLPSIASKAGAWSEGAACPCSRWSQAGPAPPSPNRADSLEQDWVSTTPLWRATARAALLATDSQRAAAGHRPRLPATARLPTGAGALITKWLGRIEVLP